MVYYNLESSWSVVKHLGLEVRKVHSNNFIFYGSSDPQPNPAELILTQLTGSHFKLEWRFFVYLHGRNLPVKNLENRLPPYILYLEDIIPKSFSLLQLAREIYRLRKEPVIICYIPRENNPRQCYRGTDVPNITVDELHNYGGWLGGNAIHYFLRLFAQENNDVLYICPFQQKGRVYEIYKGLNRPLFILTPFVRFIPPSFLTLDNGEPLPSWAPCPWGYWLSLPASVRRRVKKILQNQLFNDYVRIEIKLP